jgi:hypothetical protein
VREAALGMTETAVRGDMGAWCRQCRRAPCLRPEGRTSYCQMACHPWGDRGACVMSSRSTAFGQTRPHLSVRQSRPRSAARRRSPRPLARQESARPAVRGSGLGERTTFPNITTCSRPGWTAPAALHRLHPAELTGADRLQQHVPLLARQHRRVGVPADADLVALNDDLRAVVSVRAKGDREPVHLTHLPSLRCVGRSSPSSVVRQVFSVRRTSRSMAARSAAFCPRSPCTGSPGATSARPRRRRRWRGRSI